MKTWVYYHTYWAYRLLALPTAYFYHKINMLGILLIEPRWRVVIWSKHMLTHHVNLGELLEDATSFCSLECALQYLTFTSPNISYIVQQVYMHIHAPRKCQLHALKRIIRCIKGTLQMGLLLCPSLVSTLVSYTDADWVGCPDTRRSTSCYCVFLNDNLISWSSKWQSTVSRLIPEEEYQWIANVVAEICWLRNFLLEVSTPPQRISLVYSVKH